MILSRHIAVLFLGFWTLLGQHSFNPYTDPSLPELDYVVFKAILNDFSKCNDEKYAFLRGGVLFISPVTKKIDKHFFRFNYIRNEQNLAFSLHSQTNFYKESAWKTLIASVDTNQFIKCEIRHPLELTCRKSRIWTPEMEDYYWQLYT
jgi:hypothetical protein